jgi:membrane protein YqaA with SNARE-associated domain
MKNLFKKTDAILSKASSSPRALPYLFLFAFFEASVSPILPELYIAVLATYKKFSWKVLTLVSAFGSAVGASIVYLVGKLFFDQFGEKLLAFFHGEGIFERAKELYQINAFYAQFFASLTPLPDRVFSLFAGAFAVNFFIFFLATFLGRAVRAGITAYFFTKYGEAGKQYVKKHTKNTIIFLALVIILYFTLKYFGIL